MDRKRLARSPILWVALAVILVIILPQLLAGGSDYKSVKTSDVLSQISDRDPAEMQNVSRLVAACEEPYDQHAGAGLQRRYRRGYRRLVRSWGDVRCDEQFSATVTHKR